MHYWSMIYLVYFYHLMVIHSSSSSCWSSLQSKYYFNSYYLKTCIITIYRNSYCIWFLYRKNKGRKCKYLPEILPRSIRGWYISGNKKIAIFIKLRSAMVKCANVSAMKKNSFVKIRLIILHPWKQAKMFSISHVQLNYMYRENKLTGSLQISERLYSNSLKTCPIFNSFDNQTIILLTLK